MKIVIANFKGGMGKSMIAHQLITSYDYHGYEVDPYGSLSNRLEHNVTRLDIDSQLPNLESENVIFDFGGFDCLLLREAIKTCDLVVVPFVPTLESIQATVDTLSVLEEYDKPIMLVANMVKKPSDVDEAKKLFFEFLKIDVEVVELVDSVSLQTAIAENSSIIEMAKVGGLKGFSYKKAAQSVHNLHNQILKYQV